MDETCERGTGVEPREREARDEVVEEDMSVAPPARLTMGDSATFGESAARVDVTEGGRGPSSLDTDRMPDEAQSLICTDTWFTSTFATVGCEPEELVASAGNKIE